MFPVFRWLGALENAVRLLLTGGGWEGVPDRSNRWVKMVRVDRTGFGSTVDTGGGAVLRG